MGEFLKNERVIKPLVTAGIGLAAYAGYRMMKNNMSLELKRTPAEEARLPEDFRERLSLTNEKVSYLFARSQALKIAGNELHRSMPIPVAFIFSNTQGRFAELQELTWSRAGNKSRSAAIFPCTKENGILKIQSTPNTPEDRKGHQIYWGLTPDGIRTEARTFGSDGLTPEQALDRIDNLVHAPDLEVISMDDILKIQGL